MKHLFTITILCFLYCSLTLSQAPDTIWTKVYGDGDYERGNSIVITDDNGFAIVGAADALYSGGNLTEGDIWLVRTNSTGDTLWTKTYGGSGIDEGNSIYQTGRLLKHQHQTKHKIANQMLSNFNKCFIYLVYLTDSTSPD